MEINVKRLLAEALHHRGFQGYQSPTSDFVAVNIDAGTKTPISDLFEFCKACSSSTQNIPVNTLLSFVASEVKYDNTEEFHKIRWPGEIIRHKIGICSDFAIFMHEVFNILGIPHALGLAEFFSLVSFEYEVGHIFPIFKWDAYDGLYWIWNYYGDEPNEYAINGPYTSFDSAAVYAAPLFVALYGDYFSFNSFATNPVATYGLSFSGKELQFIDQYYADKTLNFNQLILKDPVVSNKILLSRSTFRQQYAKLKKFRKGTEWQMLPKPTVKEVPITFKPPSKNSIVRCIKGFNFKAGNALKRFPR